MFKRHEEQKDTIDKAALEIVASRFRALSDASRLQILQNPLMASGRFRNCAS